MMTVRKVPVDDRSEFKSVRLWVEYHLKQINNTIAFLFPIEMASKIRPHVTEYAHANGFWLRTRATTEGLLVYQFNVSPEYTPLRSQKNNEPMSASFSVSGDIFDRHDGESVSAFIERTLNHLQISEEARLTGVDKSLARTYIYRTALNRDRVFTTRKGGRDAMIVFRRR